MNIKNTHPPLILWKTPLLAVAFLFIFQPLFAQKIISGKVTAEGQPLVGVSIINKNSKKKTLTKENGLFKIKAKKTDSLIFRYIGYKAQKIYVGNQHFISVQLKSTSSGLNEVVVVGYGTQKKKILRARFPPLLPKISII